MMMRVCAAILLLLFGMSHDARCDEIAPSGDTAIAATLKGRVVKATFHTVRIGKSDAIFPALDESEANHVFTMVQDMKLTIGSNSVWVHRSVFSDLLDPLAATLRLANGQFVLRIDGGDGSEGYFVEIYFDEKMVSRRRMYGTVIRTTLCCENTYKMSGSKN